LSYVEELDGELVELRIEKHRLLGIADQQAYELGRKKKDPS